MTIYRYIKKNSFFLDTNELESLDSYNYDTLFYETGPCEDYSGLMSLIPALKNEDTLIISSIKDIFIQRGSLLEMLTFLINKNIHLICINDGIDTAIDEEFYRYALVFSKANDEISKSNYSGNKQDRVIGRPAISDEVINKIQFLYHEKKFTLRNIADECNVSLGAVHKYVKISITEEG